MSAARDLVYAFVNRTARKARQDIATYPDDHKYYTVVDGGSDNDIRLHGLLNRVEDDRAHAEAVKIRDFVANDPVYRPKCKRGMLEAADLIDPYEERDGKLIRKSDGKPVTL